MFVTPASNIIRTISSASFAELWLPIERAPGISVSTDGRFRNDKTGRIRKLWAHPHHGYPYLGVRPWGRKGPTVTLYAHREVARAFLGPRPPGRQICHNDGNPTNNRLSNLRYGTPIENMQDAVLHGTRGQGHKRPPRLPDDQVAELRRLHEDEGWSVYKLADHFGVCGGTVSPAPHVLQAVKAGAGRPILQKTL